MALIITLLYFLTVVVASPVANWDTQKWDIIVVGAGPAGIIAASRAAAAGLKTVLIEQGGSSYGFSVSNATQREKLRPVNMRRYNRLYKLSDDS
jgi:choline dehydrogenase-like flavoprotein